MNSFPQYKVQMIFHIYHIRVMYLTVKQFRQKEIVKKDEAFYNCYMQS